MKKNDIDAIVESVAHSFRCFGGGEIDDPGNPLSHWTKEDARKFAMGVDVRLVVEHVVKAVEKTQRKTKRSAA